jgi:hypothetical protein
VEKGWVIHAAFFTCAPPGWHTPGGFGTTDSLMLWKNAGLSTRHFFSKNQKGARDFCAQKQKSARDFLATAKRFAAHQQI